jgi:hypothetical protein
MKVIRPSCSFPWLVSVHIRSDTCTTARGSGGILRPGEKRMTLYLETLASIGLQISSSSGTDMKHGCKGGDSSVKIRLSLLNVYALVLTPDNCCWGFERHRRRSSHGGSHYSMGGKTRTQNLTAIANFAF